MAVERVKDSFKDTDVNVIELPESSATVALAAQALNTEPDQIAKTLSFLVDDAPILDVMAGKASTDNHKYKATFHKKAKMIPVDQVEDYIGGVCPFAVKVYLDESLKHHTEVYPAAGSSNSAVRLTIPALEKYSDYTAWVDVTKTA
ncbi:YbaK/EbsC family protein [Lactobacillus delbrueckii subsp. bulgaricus]|nr:prolyl-tRNA editing protein [Lactobacillus delbrueckii subsp. bulgaricus]